ncbi:hypothetical protein SH580_04795 [Coraliomargarita algicola]|uniref:Right handed beta helix domain-containing protein n=1 Tax=Coraliomargarita algicola TaxID=3092156 RepID=A0ABZ0RVM7_9BACT|nr:hypothetical protein [Coraliomargarita sp. J2-16]WPJ97024.1 hypothetical protein SH580_04795 [Coraliomargarita sp. J2-16]
MAGGENNLLKDCVGVDAIRHSGVRITTQIYIAHTMPFSGVNRLDGVSLLRCGSDKHGAYNGAIQVEAHGHPVESIEIADCNIFASPYAAIQIYNKIDERGQGGLEMSCVITDCTVTGAALSGLHIGPDTPGHVEVNNTQFSSCMLGDVQNDSDSAKLIINP